LSPATVVVSGITDEGTLHAVLEAVEVGAPSGEFSLRLRRRPDGYDDIVPPRLLGNDAESRRTLAGDSGHVAINEVPKFTEPLLAAGFNGADLTAVDFHGGTSWIGEIVDVQAVFCRLRAWWCGAGSCRCRRPSTV
jgi:hypothetical protein